MAKIKLTKTELKTQQDALKQYRRYLPTLQIKKQQLQQEIRLSRERLEENLREREKLVETLSGWIALFGDVEMLHQLQDGIRLERIRRGRMNIAGIMVLSRLGIKVEGRKFDTMILHYLLDPESRHGMNQLALRYLNYKPIEIESLIGRGAKQLTMDLVAVERVAEYAAEDADITLQLKQALMPLVEEQGLLELYHRIEEPMIDVLAEMELTGVCIDSALLNNYAIELNARLVELERQVREEAGEPTLNINSTRQLGEVLFSKMRITDKPKMTTAICQ